MEALLQALRATAEPTRLRILAVLARSELTVSELCRVLGQTQPRVSRHLRLLCEAGLLDRHSQGTNAYYRPRRLGDGQRLYEAVLPLIADDDPTLGRDLARLAEIRRDRAAAAAEYFELVAADWEQTRALHVADDEVEQAMITAVDEVAVGDRVGDLLDIGTGTGRVLEVFAERIDHGLGIDLSRQMLNLARSRLDQLGHSHCSVQHGNVYDLNVDVGSIDVAVLHHVLHFLDDPATAIAEAARTLRPGGRLIVVDFAPHGVEYLKADYAHHWLGFADDEITTWCEDAGLLDVRTTHLTQTSEALTSGDGEDSLTVTLWVAAQRLDVPALYSLEVAS